MQVLPDLQLLDQAQFVPSPNYDERPENASLDLIVVHGISLPPNQFGGEGVTELFTNQLNPQTDPYYAKIDGLRVSSHLFIRRDGSVIQYVPFDKRAWHAGLSSYHGRQSCNDFSIGIELEGTDFTPYTATQYQSLAQSIHAIWQAYPQMPTEAVTGHSDIAPGRKTDPGVYFVWEALERLLQQRFLR
ncbi:1,6-anhydro-N-acetylmuramyl-L-alanine amidase AmpD [Thiomicrorhabdus sp. 6S3-12]|uniref:1,6-anhydro-N-acetylmuramyl-L-alanine amidase AmpD n=1 Tax=Thiomicrorhabdus sp. 6S3-12 TaxID=2819681 RepID=UPI001AACCF48|nr:1,6-anhydro-N-acetylmuramyl-L-alanine amidase AmpD [Thiomicrorhabdus sp. 6S3-12]MBO1924361.1 1,6-anhydro-N-acetylmuramyl-L-alanine amidase AmpD [Thiomicrorhabdus sp. 6S3-12]